MYENILVPLDGSEPAEAALPHATQLAKAVGARVTLLMVIQPISVYPQPGMVGPVVSVSMNLEDEEEQGRQYLDRIVKRLELEGVDAGSVVKKGDPASEICDHAQENNIDLIVMSTHGRSGIRRWVYGSVAERVLRGANVPVLLVRAKPGE